MKDTIHPSASVARTTLGKRNQQSILQSFTRAISDCLVDEIDLLNKDMEDDAFLSGFKNFISGECIEFREDQDEDYRLAAENRHADTTPMRRVTENNPTTTIPRHELAELQTMAEPPENDDDDERTDFLVTREDGRIAVPSTVVFKPKKRRREGNQNTTQTSDDVSVFYFQKPTSSDFRVQTTSTATATTDSNKKHPIAWWKKKGLLTFRRSKSAL